MSGAPVWDTALPAGECHVWWARPADAPGALSWLLAGDERARSERFAFREDRLQYVVAHALTRMVVAGYLGAEPAGVGFVARCWTCGGPHGKPYLTDPPGGLELSLSHCRERVVVAVARRVAVGVDVEAINPCPDDGIEQTALSPAERRELDTWPERQRRGAFLRYWVRKEAVLKATGHGLTVPPALLTVSGPGQPPRLLDWPPPLSTIGLPVQLHDLAPGDGFVASLALLAGMPHRIVERDGDVVLRRGAERGVVDRIASQVLG